MKVQLTGDGLLFSGLPETVEILLRTLPNSPELGDPLARQRLFPQPVEAGSGAIAEDWREFVVPELAHLFDSAQDTVAKDVARIKPGSGGAELKIPAAHFRAWLSCLNQVRLAIAAANRLDERELTPEEEERLPPLKRQAAAKIHFYGYLQEILLSAMGEL